ncbi:hypothetical protein EVAR_60560_1 [Eumeta japonica]|uniref:Uncharacterized protein n=1 Tax=Eumeta variegata TaxID=151549 RepID=A0A4C1YH86_EUMVA|nr:hypothetical protein EVAR_60560_1 [Eumeta japonica]
MADLSSAAPGRCNNVASIDEVFMSHFVRLDTGVLRSYHRRQEPPHRAVSVADPPYLSAIPFKCQLLHLQLFSLAVRATVSRCKRAAGLVGGIARCHRGPGRVAPDVGRGACAGERANCEPFTGIE